MKSESSKPAAPERCARCGGEVARWRQYRAGKVYCTAFCSKAAEAETPKGPDHVR